MTPPPIIRFRVARQTDRLSECRRFYEELIGLPVLASWENHAGYDGVVLGLPGSETQLELLHHVQGSPASPSGAEDQLVLYLSSRAGAEEIAARCVSAGFAAVEPENPYWDGRALLVPDPDGRLVVLDWGLAEE